MRFSIRYGVYLLLIIAILWIIYLGRGVLPPFILAAGFAYILNPLVGFLTHRTKIPRTLAIALIYLILIGSLALVVLTVGARLAEESESFSVESKNFLHEASLQVTTFPLWLQPVVSDLLITARGTFISGPRHVAAFLPGVVNGTINILVFLIAAFYFLKDGGKFMNAVFNLFPSDLRFEAEVVVKKVNRVLGDYLRAQMFLVIIMSTFTYGGLSILGVRYALILAIFTGFLEIVPFVGPVVAAAVAMVVAYTDGLGSLGLDPFTQVAAVGILYLILRQSEDLFVIPNVLGKMTKLHPLVVLFSVLLAGHLFGVLGVILAVPLVASLKVVLEHALEVLDRKV